MTPVDIATAGTALLLALAAGLLAHELAHATALRALGVPCDVAWFPDEDGLLGGGLLGRWAAVTPRVDAGRVAPWRLRVASMTPLALALPLVAVAAGAAPDPLAAGHPAPRLAVVGWLACALPSPQDFSVLFYAGRALPTDDA